MEGDWAARLISKRQYTVHSFLDQHLVDDMESEDELRLDFACPYCFEVLDIFSLCSHIEDEHCFETRLVVCPICVAKVGKDIVVHITTQHAGLFKISFETLLSQLELSLTNCLLHGQRRRRFRRAAGAAATQSTFSLIGKELNPAQLQALLGTSTCTQATGTGVAGATGVTRTGSAIPDIFLSTLVNIPVAEVDEAASKLSLESVEEAVMSKPQAVEPQPSPECCLTAEEREQKLEQATLRSNFMQQLVLSTLW